MSIEPISSLDSLEFFAYLDNRGMVNEDWQNQIAVYAIFDRDKQLQFVGYSRDLYSSLKKHLVRVPEQCYWLKLQTISRPSRTILAEIRQSWIAENGRIPAGNGEDEAKWSEPIDAKTFLTAEERATLTNTDELGKIKILKQLARKVEAEVEARLQARGCQMDLRFNPKLKEEGLLDLK
jgi:hypothetical protein